MLGLATGLASAQPSVIVVMVDDLDVNTTQEMLAAGLLPNLKSRLVDPGVRFTNYVVTDPRCCPSRASFLTGQYPHNHHTTEASQFQEASALPCWLPSSYWSVFIGKYLNGYGSNPSKPVTDLENPNHRPPCWSRWAAMIDYSTYTAFDYVIHDSVNGQSVLTDHRQFGHEPWNYNADMQTIRLLLAIEESRTMNRPLFAVVNYVAPHFQLETRDPPFRIVNVCQEAGGQPAPFHPSDNLFGDTLNPAARHLDTLTGHPEYGLTFSPSFNEADLTDKAAWFQPLSSLEPIDIDCLVKQDWRRKESMRAVDDGLGLIFAALDAKGLAGSTFVVFTSDNGYFRGEHRLTEKALLYREARHVPLYLVGPSLKSRTVTQLTANIDLAPTIAAWTGASPTVTVDGRSLIPLFTGTGTMWRNAVVLESQQNEYPGLVDAFGLLTVNPPRFYLAYVNGQRELYDLDTDRFEMDSQAQAPARAAEVSAWQAYLNGLKTCVGVVCRLGEILVHWP